MSGGLLLGVPAQAAPPKPRSEEWWFVVWDIQDKVWQQIRGQGITVALVDSGVNASLPELRNVVLPGFDARHGYHGDSRQDVKNFDVGRDFEPNEDDSAGHGTGMAALIAGQGGLGGVVGIAPETRILPVVSDAFRTTWVKAPSGRPSWSPGHQHLDGFLIPWRLSIRRTGGGAACHRRKSVIVAAMGNEGNTSNSMLFPASCAGVLGVGAVNNQKLAWTGTQRQSYVSAAAPGVGIGIRQRAGHSTTTSTGPAGPLRSPPGAVNPDTRHADGGLVSHRDEAGDLRLEDPSDRGGDGARLGCPRAG